MTGIGGGLFIMKVLDEPITKYMKKHLKGQFQEIIKNTVIGQNKKEAELN